MGMSDTYKGESPGKKLARARTWSVISLHLGSRLRSGGKIAVLASREGGDVATLLGLGVPASSIVAIDRDAEAAAACQARWPAVDVRVGDAFEIAEKMGGKCVVAFFDLCGPLDGIACAGFTRVARRLPRDAILAVAGMRGRERNIVVKRYAEQARKRESRAVVAHRARGHDIEDSAGMDLYRVRAVQDHLKRSLAGVRVGPVCLTVVNYQSSNSDSHGVPMTIGVFELRRGDLIERHDDFARRMIGAEWEAVQKYGVGDFGRCTDADVRAAALSMRLNTQEVALALNINPGTVAAWKAHASRGSYGATG
jgi:hypothetical protein